MTENTKTLTFAGTALAVLLLALFVSRPQIAGDSVPADLNQKFFPKFEDPLAAKSLEIIDYDQETGQRSVFEVAQDAKGIWSIPSHGGYPADAEKQLAEAAASVIDLKKGNLESTDASQQATYGVVEPPDPKSDSKKGEGVGKQVTLRDKDKNILAQFIIGKEVKGRTPAGDPEGPQPVPLRYVRVPNSDAIYTAAVKIDKLSTRFDDWIERDLLKMKLGVYHVKEVLLNDYTVNLQQQIIDERGTSTLAFDSKSSTWSPIDIKMVDKLSRQLINRPLKDDEEIDNQKLNDMKNALNDLRIADVQRKPAGLSADLQANQQFMKSQQARDSLEDRGYYMIPVNEQMVALFSKEGEVRCRMNDGVEYVLRFGDVAGRGKAEDLEDDKPADDKKTDEAKKPANDKSKKADADKTVEGAAVSVLVAVRFNPDMIPKPQLEALPPEDAKPAGPEPDAKPDDKKNEEKPADKETGAKKESDKKDSEDKTGDEKKSDDKKPEEGGDEKKPVNSERDRIEKENQKKQDEYDKQVKKGEERVAELNRRFADWYYVIPDKTYQKIHLTQADIIKKKASPADQAAPGTGGLPQGGGDPFMQKILGGQTPSQTPAAPTAPATTTTPATVPAATTPPATAPSAPAKTTPAAPKTPAQPPAKSGTAPKKPAVPKK